jgi:hypothetical protein
VPVLDQCDFPVTLPALERGLIGTYQWLDYACMEAIIAGAIGKRLYCKKAVSGAAKNGHTD